MIVKKEKKQSIPVLKKQLARLLPIDKKFSSAEFYEYTKINKLSAAERLRQLVREGLLIKFGNGKGAKYLLTNDNAAKLRLGKKAALQDTIEEYIPQPHVKKMFWGERITAKKGETILISEFSE